MHSVLAACCHKARHIEAWLRVDMGLIICVLDHHRHDYLYENKIAENDSHLGASRTLT